MSEQIDQLLQEAASAARGGDKSKARTILSQIVRENPRNARAWYMLSQVVDNLDQAEFCLKKALEIDPGSQRIRERLNNLLSLGLDDPKSTTSNAPASKPIQPQKSQPQPQSPAPPPKIVENSPKKKKSALTGCIIILLALICVGLIATMGESDGSSSRSSTKKPTATYAPSKSDAVYMCMHFVEERLKAPSTAKFQRSSEAGVSQSGNDFTVVSYVDSQNSFGAMIRTHYVCVVRYTGNNDIWHLESLITDP